MHLDDLAAAKCEAETCAPAPSRGPVAYKMTTGIKWCSGGGDVQPGDSFGAGVDGNCPLIPQGWTMGEAATKCEAVCTNASTCVGFTLYPDVAHRSAGAPGAPTPHECCFRTGSVASQPKVPGSDVRCYAKPPQPVVCAVPQ